MKAILSHIIVRIRRLSLVRNAGRIAVSGLGLIRCGVASSADRNALARFLYKDPVERAAFAMDEPREQDDPFLIIARIFGSIVGVAVISRYARRRPEESPDDRWLSGLFVSPALRGLGIGQRIVERAILTSRSTRASHLNLIVNRDNDPAVGLYRKLGFREMTEPSSQGYRDLTTLVSSTEIIMSYPLTASGTRLAKNGFDGLDRTYLRS